VDALVEPFRDPFVARAFLELALLGLVGGLLGPWIVLLELSYSAESLAHGMFPGLVAAALVGVPTLAGGLAGVLVAALALAAAGRIPGLGRDTAVGIVVTTSFAAGVLLALAPATPTGVGELLFGDLLAVSGEDLASTAALAVLVAVALAALHGQLLAVGLDAAAAPSLGARRRLAETGLALLVALAVLGAARALGTLLAVAILVAPAATALLAGRRLPPTMALAVGVALIGAAGGLVLSFHAGTAAGASVALVLVGLYLLARLVRGLARAARTARSPAGGAAAEPSGL
jgi:ABC-type Mn2+/Zn2+ transport system permease subunit